MKANILIDHNCSKI